MNNECIHYIKRAFKTAYPVVGRNHSFGVPTMYKVNSESEYLSEVKELSKLSFSFSGKSFKKINTRVKGYSTCGMLLWTR